MTDATALKCGVFRGMIDVAVEQLRRANNLNAPQLRAEVNRVAAYLSDADAKALRAVDRARVGSDLATLLLSEGLSGGGSVAKACALACKVVDELGPETPLGDLYDRALTIVRRTP